MLQNHQLSKYHSPACAQHKQVLLHLPNSIAQEEAPVDQCEKRGGRRSAEKGKFSAKYRYTPLADKKYSFKKAKIITFPNPDFCYR